MSYKITYKLYRIGPDNFKCFLQELDDLLMAEEAFKFHCHNGLPGQQITIEKVICTQEVIQRYKFFTRVASGEPVC